MALINQGILGGFRKKIGKVVGAHWRTLDTIRALPRSSGKLPSQKQLNQQIKFALVTGFTSRMGGLIDVGFKSGTGGATPMNEAVAYHLKNAIVGVEPDFELDYSKVKFSRGKLELADVTVVNAANALEFTWPYEGPDDKLVDGRDWAVAMVYNPVKDRFIKNAQLATRATMAATLALPGNFEGDLVHIYFAFFSATNKALVSETLYVQEIQL